MGFAPDADIHILDRIAVIYRYRRIAIAVFALTTAAMMIQGYSMRERRIERRRQPRRVAQRSVALDDASNAAHIGND